MGKAAAVLTIVTVTLLAAELAVVAVRLSSCAERREPAWILALLSFLVLRLAFPHALSAPMFLSIASIWAAAGLLARIDSRPLASVWHLGSAAPVLVILAALAIGYGSSIPLRAFHAFSVLLLAGFSVPALARAWRRTRSVPLLAAVVCVLAWAAASVVRDILLAAGASVPDIPALLLFLLAGSIGALVLLDGYPWAGGLRGRAHEGEAKGNLLNAAYARLLETENALVLQDRLIASGLLALGAAHEFKNSLSHIRAAAQVGLSAPDPGSKDESLRFVLEQARAGSGAAIAFLERLSREGREQERVVDAREDLEGLLRVSRASVRPDGILIRAALQAGVRFRARPSEIGQVLLNLVDNSVQSLRRREGEAERFVEITAASREGHAVIEVRDNGGGIAPEAAQRLFSLRSPTEEGTGIGLYLSRSLAERNGGFLDHIPLDGGSCFRLAFPLAPQPPTVA
jgi:signal transduction histidine kinase